MADRAEKHDKEGVEIRARREELIVAAIAAGWSHREIAKISGLSNQRIGQIAQIAQPSTINTNP